MGTASSAMISGWRRMASPWKANSRISVSSSAAIDSFYVAERYAEVQRRLERERIQPVFGRDAGGRVAGGISVAGGVLPARGHG